MASDRLSVTDRPCSAVRSLRSAIAADIVAPTETRQPGPTTAWTASHATSRASRLLPVRLQNLVAEHLRRPLPLHARQELDHAEHARQQAPPRSAEWDAAAPAASRTSSTHAATPVTALISSPAGGSTMRRILRTPAVCPLGGPQARELALPRGGRKPTSAVGAGRWRKPGGTSKLEAETEMRRCS